MPTSLLTDISENSIKKWCEGFNIYNLILSLPEKFETIITEKSSNISGGERQKLSLIRTFLKNPQVIILDEPTSLCDNNTKKALMLSLNQIKKDKIIIIVTHDTELNDVADEIINLNNFKL